MGYVAVGGTAILPARDDVERRSATDPSMPAQTAGGLRSRRRWRDTLQEPV